MTHRVNHDMKVIEIFCFSYFVKTLVESNYVLIVIT